MNDKQTLNHLLHLADDPDETIWTSVKESIVPYLNREELPKIQQMWQQSENPLQAERLEQLIHEAQFGFLREDFKQFLAKRNPDLGSGIVLINRIVSQEFNKEKLDELIAPIRKDIWLELSERLTALEKVRIMNHLLFEKYQLQKKPGLEAKSVHLYLPTLLRTKTGHALTLAALFCLIARYLELPIYKVSTGDLPALAFLDIPNGRTVSPGNLNNYPVLFYITIARQIEVYGRKQFLEYVNHLYPTGNQNDDIVEDTILIRTILSKLKLLYHEENNVFRREQISKLLSLF